MKYSPAVRRLAALVLAAAAACPVALGQAVQRGVYLHAPADFGMRIDNARSGELCAAPDGEMTVCNKALRIEVTGRDTCDDGGRDSYPCTRYGYAFDYEGVEAGNTLDCEVTRKTAFRENSAEYSIPLEAAEGEVFLPTRIGYRPVERRTLLSEVHRCSYRGTLVASFEYMLNFEPGRAAAASGDPDFDEIPDACGIRPEFEGEDAPLAGEPRPNDPRIEHIPSLQSHCVFGYGPGSDRTLGFLFKFMPLEMFDVDKLDPMQLTFNATFVSGGVAPSQTLNDLGRKAFVYADGKRTSLSVITGLSGPPDFAGRARTFLALYYLEDGEETHPERLALIRRIAERHVADWQSR